MPTVEVQPKFGVKARDDLYSRRRIKHCGSSVLTKRVGAPEESQCLNKREFNCYSILRYYGPNGHVFLQSRVPLFSDLRTTLAVNRSFVIISK